MLMRVIFLCNDTVETYIWVLPRTCWKYSLCPSLRRSDYLMASVDILSYNSVWWGFIRIITSRNSQWMRSKNKDKTKVETAIHFGVGGGEGGGTVWIEDLKLRKNGIANSAREKTGVGKTENYRRGILFNHFALKMEAVMISKRSAVQHASSWCHHPDIRSILYQFY